MLLAEVDEALGQLSGPATKRALWRMYHVFGDKRFERLGHRRHNVGLRVAALAHVLDRAADMLAVPLDRTPGRIREVLDDPERVRAALTHADPEGARLIYGGSGAGAARGGRARHLRLARIGPNRWRHAG